MKPTAATTPRAADRDVQKDYALSEALNALKVLALRNKPIVPAVPASAKG